MPLSPLFFFTQIYLLGSFWEFSPSMWRGQDAGGDYGGFNLEVLLSDILHVNSCCQSMERTIPSMG